MASTTTWTGLVSNLWTDSGNWTNGVPTYDNTPVINASSSIAIDLNGSQNTNFIETTGTGTVTFTDGTLALNGNFTMASGQSIVVDGATLTGQTVTTSSGTATSGTITVTNGATLQFDEIDTTLNFGPASSSYTNTVNFTDGGKNIPVITNLSPGDLIVFTNKSWNHGLQFVETGTDSSGNTTYKILDGYGGSTPLVSSVTLAPGITPSDFAWDDSKHAIVCFLAGSMIRTPSGDVAVEDIQIGDEVLVFDDQNNMEVSRKVVWAGRAHCSVKLQLPDDEAGWPVRVLKNAIDNGVPSKDLLITSEHCLFFAGNFVPARMLVNNRSIFYDRTIQSYDYFHIETEEHSVIFANDMRTESYLDTGNRRSFMQKGNVIQLGAKDQSWEKDAAGCLMVTRNVVEFLFRQIEDRARALHLPLLAESLPLTLDSDIRLSTDTGLIIRPTRQAGDKTLFMIPGSVKSVRIVSKTSRPSDVIGPFVDDRRQLGVLVGSITLYDSGSSTPVTSHLREPELAGWSSLESTPMRWTVGNAMLSLRKRASESVGMLAIQIHAAGPYVAQNEPTERLSRIA